MKKITQYMTVLGYTVALLFGTVVTVFVTSDMDKSTNGYLYINYALPQIAYLLAYFGIFLYCKRPIKDLLPIERVHGADYPMALLAGIGIFFFALLPNTYLQMLLQDAGNTSSVAVPVFSGVGEYLLAALTICLLPALGEELIFRKLFVDAGEGTDGWTLVWTGGLFFSLSHFSVLQTVHQFVLGAMLVLIYVRTKNITLTMMIHFLNNFLALFLESFTGTEIWQKIWVLGICCAVGGILVAGSILYFIKKYPLKKEKKKPELAVIILLAVLAIAWVATVAIGFLR